VTIVKNNKEKLLAALNESDWRARLEAVEQLAEVRDEDLLEALIEIVKDHHHDLNALNAALKLLSLPARSFFPGLQALMQDPDPEVRTYAAVTLGLVGDERGIPILIKALDDPDKNVRFVAIEGLGRLKAAAAVDPLIEILKGEDFFLKFPAVQAVANIGDPSPIPQLLLLLQDEVLSEPVITAFGTLGGDDVVPYICAYLNDPRADTLIAAAALVSIYTRSPNTEQTWRKILSHLTFQGRAKLAAEVPEVPPIELSTDEQHEYENLAVLLRWLVQTFPEESTACEALVRLLSFPGARRKALEGLETCAPHILPILAHAIDDPDQDIRQAAMRLFTANAQLEDLPVLREALQSEYPELAALAAEGLARLKDASVYELLLEKVDHPVAYVRRAVLQALEALNHPNHTQHMLALLEDSNPLLREAAVGALARQQQHEYSARILAALADSNENVRKAAVEALPHLKDPQALYTLEEMTRAEDVSMRISAVKALADCPVDFALPLLYDALQDDHYWVRIHACRALAKHKQDESFSYLAQILTDPVPPVRIAALEALTELEGQGILMAVLPMLEDENSDVQKTAQRVVDRLRPATTG
jgi:HEAT repeat protein